MDVVCQLCDGALDCASSGVSPKKEPKMKCAVTESGEEAARGRPAAAVAGREETAMTRLDRWLG